MVAGAAFADPEADFNLAEVSGNASVTWGVDLDKGTTGFKNETGAKIKLNLVNSGTKSTSGEGIWAELGIKLDNNMVIQADGDGKTSAVADGKIVVDVAKLHFYNFYVGIKSGDTTVGKLELPNAVRSSWAALADVVDTKREQGIVLGYGDNKNINFEFDFRSNKAALTAAVDGTKYVEVINNATGVVTVVSATVTGTEITYDATAKTYKANDGYTVVREIVAGAAAAGADNYYTNDYGLAAEFKLLDSNEYVNGLFATVGGSLQLGTASKPALGAAASAGYKLALNDTFYVKPVVGFTMAIADVSASTINPTMNLAGGLVFGWGDETDANAGVYYLDNDQAKKVTPGVGVNVLVPLVEKPTIVISPSFYSGSIVENLTAAATADISIPSSGEAGIAVAGGLKYAIAATDSVTVTPQVGARFATKSFTGAAKAVDSKYTWSVANTDNGGESDLTGTANGLLNLKAGLDVAGLINNTTFSVWYQSRNLLNTTDGAKKLGTINVQCKISF